MTRTRVAGVAFALAAAVAPARAAEPPTPAIPPPPAHPLHLATAQVAVEGRRVLVRLRTFEDDLEAALARFSGRESVSMAATPELDSLYLAYVAGRLAVAADGAELHPSLLASGVDLESGTGDTKVWWALLEYEAASEIRELGVRATVLYDLFDDQRNVIRVLHPATDRRHTFYFAAPDDDLRTVRFD